MADANTNTLLYTAVYDNKDDALADLYAVEDLHKEALIGDFDAAVIDHKNGKPHVEKRLDRPRVRFIPEMFGGGKLPRKELHEAATDLMGEEAGLVVVGDATIDKALEKAITRTGKVAKREFDEATDTIVSELNQALVDWSKEQQQASSSSSNN